VETSRVAFRGQYYYCVTALQLVDFETVDAFVSPVESVFWYPSPSLAYAARVSASDTAFVDGASIASEPFTTVAGGTASDCQGEWASRSALFARPLSSGKAEVISVTESAAEARPVAGAYDTALSVGFSLDERWLKVSAANGLFVAALNNGVPAEATRVNSELPSTASYIRSSSVAPNGEAIAYVADQDTESLAKRSWSVSPLARRRPGARSARHSILADLSALSPGRPTLPASR
jgi:hypothetical protein